VAARKRNRVVGCPANGCSIADCSLEWLNPWDINAKLCRHVNSERGYDGMPMFALPASSGRPATSRRMQKN
jgi:hypothetical protein